jgi:hypothetical protein
MFKNFRTQKYVIKQEAEEITKYKDLGVKIQPM